MNRKGIVALAFASLACTSFSPAASDTLSSARFAPVTALIGGKLSILTYNVKGLPWPVAAGRPEALTRIGDTLAGLRAKGEAPHVVLLQEAFTEEARAIARRAGYRYVAYGPASGDIQPRNASAVRPREWMKGESFGPMLSSGLVMMSDFRISDIRRKPFPAGACSGYDCLANKGMLAARLAVPGIASAVEIVTTHLNSGNPSGQPEPVSRLAYQQQVKALDDFVAQDKLSPTVRIFAGDFNVGHSYGRLSALVGYFKKNKIKGASAQGREKYEGLCLDKPASCRRDLALAANVPLEHTADWQFYSAPGDVRLNAVARKIMFGKDRQGQMLSDHFGLNVVYQFR